MHFFCSFYALLQIAFPATTDDTVGDILVATFDRRGKYIVTGSSKGRIAFYDSKTVNLVTHIKQGNSFHQVSIFAIFG